MKNNQYHYLSLPVVASNEKKQKRRLIIGIIITVLFAFGIVSGITHPEQETRKYIAEYIVLMLPGIWLLISSFLIGKQIGAAKRLETIISEDKDGIVTAQELSGQLGKDPGKVFSEIETLFRKGYFHDCTLQRDGTPAIIVGDALIDGGAGTGFVVVICPSCGGTNRIRAGSRGQCHYCSAPIMDNSQAL